MFWLLFGGILALAVALDLRYKFLVKPVPATAALFLTPHLFFWYNIAALLPAAAVLPFRIFTFGLAGFFMARFAFHTAKPGIRMSRRSRIMMGGRRIFLASATAMALQIPATVLLLLFRRHLPLGGKFLFADVLTTSLLTAGFMINGAGRIFFTSKRLGIIKRLLFLALSWVPLANILYGVYLCRIVKKEYLDEYRREQLQNIRAESQSCATKYPLLLLHGIGFRDFKLLNYWGRIPEILTRNGARIEYGKQQAWGSIENNAAEIKEQLLNWLEETGSEKVNIIAHSKGGLDARYMISSLGMADKVASLTTISTPHRGSELVDVLGKMEENKYRKLCNSIDKTFRRLGDSSPDAYTSGKQLAPEYLEKFNEQNPDMPGVYYQSYASEMKNPTSHGLLSIPQAIMKWKAGNNDGLVTIESAKWGEFRGTIKSANNRGISHADQIDMMRMDYDGFDIPEEYVKIVSELKEKGL